MTNKIEITSYKSKALPAAVTMLSVAFFAGCKPNSSDKNPAVTDNNSELKHSIVNNKITDSVDLLREGFLLTNQTIPDVLSPDKIEVTNLNRTTATGGFSGAHWDPRDKKIKIEKSLLDSSSIIAIALVLGHEAVHAKFDYVDAKNLSPSQYCDSEIRAHGQEVTSVIPAIRAALINRGLLGDFEKVTLDLYETNGRFASLTYLIRKDVYISFEHNLIPRIQQFAQSSSEINEQSFNLLREINLRWRAAIEKRSRARHEYVSELQNFIQALEKASSHNGLSEIFEGNTEQISRAKNYQMQADMLAKKADDLADIQSRLR